MPTPWPAGVARSRKATLRSAGRRLNSATVPWRAPCCFEGDDAGIELTATLCLLDGVLGEFFIAGGDRDPHQLGIVGYLEGEQGEQLQTIVMTEGAEPVVGLARFTQRHRVQRQIPGGVGPNTRGARPHHDFRDLGHLRRTALVARVNIQLPQGNHRRSLEYADNQVRLVTIVQSLKCDRRLAELAHLEHLTPS